MTADDLAEQTFLFAQDLPEYWVEHHLPTARSAASVTTLPGFQEMLAYAASGHGVAVVGAQVEQLYPRPDLACVPIAGGPTFDYALVWRTDDLSPLAATFLRHARREPGQRLARPHQPMAPRVARSGSVGQLRHAGEQVIK